MGASNLPREENPFHSVDQPSLVPARHASGDTRSSDLRDLAQVKREVAWSAAGSERASAHAGPRGVPGRGRPALLSDSGLAGCASLSGTHQVAAGDYPKMAAQFASSRWPKLRISGLAYVEIATQLRETPAYGGETVWFYQQLSAACAKHGQPLDF